MNEQPQAWQTIKETNRMQKYNTGEADLLQATSVFWENKFWKYVNKDEMLSDQPSAIGNCWVWTGSVRYLGYGVIKTRQISNSVSAHRASWIMHNGQIPVGLCVLHKCDNPSCVRPDHLFLGTKKDNTADMIAKGRSKIGINNGKAILKEKDIPKIRSLGAKGVKQKEIGLMFGVHRATVSDVLRGITFRHVP